jgi:hypothetical protein
MCEYVSEYDPGSGSIKLVPRAIVQNDLSTPARFSALSFMTGHWRGNGEGTPNFPRGNNAPEFKLTQDITIRQIPNMDVMSVKCTMHSSGPAAEVFYEESGYIRPTGEGDRFTLSMASTTGQL